MATFLAGASFVFAILYAKGWALDQSYENAIALIALGLLFPLLAAGLAWTPKLRATMRPPDGGPQ